MPNSFPRTLTPLPFLLLLLLLSLPLTTAVKSQDFKTCSQTSFCRRLRSLSTRATVEGFSTPYTAHSPYEHGRSIPIDKHGKEVRPPCSWTFPVESSLYPGIQFNLQIDILAQGDIARLRMDEKNSATPWKRYNESAKWALLDSSPPLAPAASCAINTAGSTTTVTYGPKRSYQLKITTSPSPGHRAPFKIVHLQGGVEKMVFNDRGLFHMEHFRTKPEPAGVIPEEVKVEEGVEGLVTETLGHGGGGVEREWFEGEVDGDLFEESWGRWRDSKPKGPEGFSFDVTFPDVQDVVGLAEHATPLSLPDTTGSDGATFSDPYRLYNVDIFEYEASSPLALYGAIPLLHALSPSSSIGLLSLVGSETWVDVLHTPTSTQTHWISESGILDLLILPGPNPTDLFKQYAGLTGTTPLPPQWSIGYHQCRWNYVDSEDVRGVQRRFEEEDIPLDVTWLDIEYAEEHRYFMWDKKLFPDPVALQNEIGEKGRKMVAIVDPHFKKAEDFSIYTSARSEDLIIKKPNNGGDFEGWCWSGSSVWVDYFKPASWGWWKEKFGFGVWKDSTKHLHIWNDMNEPSVFDGPEITMNKDNIHHGGWEHRDLHNINGMMFQRATYEAMQARETPARRPFVLSRSFFVGSQRYGAIWTGDNLGTWEHMAGETAMLLQNNIAGMTFVGADVGGFFGNPSTEMLVRWYQAGTMMPFFRAHAHIDTKRREPYLFDEPYKGMMRDAIRLRYTLMPIWYNAFREASVEGLPIMRPQYAMFPRDVEGFAIDDQYYIGGSGLLVKPVTAPGVDESEVYLSDNQPYYNYFTHHLYPSSKTPRNIKVPSPLSTFPVLIQGGSILPTRSRIRRASSLMWRDPFTLIITVGEDGGAKGELYLDDGESYSYEKGEYIWRGFELSHGRNNKYTLSSINLVGSALDSSTAVNAYSTNNNWAQQIAHVRIEKVVILGLKHEPKSISTGEKRLQFEWVAGVGAAAKGEGGASRLVVKDPGVVVVEDWKIEIR